MTDNKQYQLELKFGSNLISNMSGILTLEGENQISLETGKNSQL